MQRLRFYDCRHSRLPGLLGLCEADQPNIANYVNAAQRRLLLSEESGDEGYWGTWAEVAFTVSRLRPYLTTPREIARIQVATVCQSPIQIQNQFFEYLDFGNGRLPKTYQTCGPVLTQGLTRNNVPTFVDLTNGPQIIRIYAVDPADHGKRVLMQGLDNNGKTIRSVDTYNPTQGVFVTLTDPFVDVPTQLTRITGVQKDRTIGNVEIHQVDPTDGTDILLLTMEPSEETASYRRYYFDSLPNNCCQNLATNQNVTVTAICKLDLIPVQVDTDYCLFQNLEAITEECQSVRLSEMDSADAKAQSRERHKAACKLLNGELTHFLGTQKPAVSFYPFGSATLARAGVGRLF